MLDRIHIRDLTVHCIIGFKEWEREKKQEVLINVCLHADLLSACRSDRVEDTVDYKTLKNNIIEVVEKSDFQLIERLAEVISDLCLADPRVERVDVTVDKPGALRFARSAAVEITRFKATE